MDKRKNRGKEKKQKSDVKEKDVQEDIISEEVGVHQDFGFLINAPVSEDDHFVFKSEKSWTVDTSKYSEFFTLDLKQLCAALECVPFLENVNIDQKYFTKDQLTSMYNKAERAKESYKRLVESLEAEESPASEPLETQEAEGTTESKENADAQDDNLEFLLNLSQPITGPPIVYKTSTTYGEKTEAGTKKTIDLEKWLDSVLDD